MVARVLRKLALQHTPCADADGRGLAYAVAGLAGQIPLGWIVELGKAACALEVCCHGQSDFAGGHC